MKRRSLIISIVFGIYVISLFVCGNCMATCDEIKKSPGQTLYLPISYNDFSYTNADGAIVYSFAIARLLVSNTDLDMPIHITSAIAYSPDGEPIKDFFETPETLLPLSSISLPIDLGIPYYDKDDGFPSMIVEWEVDSVANKPLIAVAIGHITIDGYGYTIDAFDSQQGLVMKEKKVE